VTLKKLTRNNPTMTAKFSELKYPGEADEQLTGLFAGLMRQPHWSHPRHLTNEHLCLHHHGPHFDTAARDWDQRPMSQQLAAVPPRLLAHLPLAPTDHVLDFGAGTGLLATQIAPRVAQVTALDMSGAMLQVLADKGFANITPHQGDIFAGLPGRYHAIVSCMALHHVADTTALMQAFASTLHPGGRVALVDLYQEDGSFHGDNEAKGVHHFGFVPRPCRHRPSTQACGTWRSPKSCACSTAMGGSTPCS
jgi:2-polyprenyl-3-methyl-5-hydroxy-6-metoxy-1,4-benzoquinol methylase